MVIRLNKTALKQIEHDAERKVSEATQRAYAAASKASGVDRKARAFANELKKSGIEPNLVEIRKLFGG